MASPLPLILSNTSNRRCQYWLSSNKKFVS